MKRKIITAILAITVVFSAASCGSAENKSSNTQEATVSDTRNSTERVSEAAGDTQSEEMTATVMMVKTYRVPVRQNQIHQMLRHLRLLTVKTLTVL